jgi:polar amino acid transport system substrate-binding protein
MHEAVGRISQTLAMLRVLLVIFIIGLAPVSGRAETVWVDDANPPFMYGKHGQVRGIYPDLTREIFRRAKIPLTIRAFPLKRVMKNAASEKVSVAGAYRTPERLKKYAFTHLIYVEDLMVYQRNDNAVPINNIDDLDGYVIGTVRGWNYGPRFNEHRNQARFEVSEAANDKQNMKMLAMGRIDMVIAIREAGNETLRRLDLGDIIKASPEPLFSYPTYIAVNRASSTTSLIPVLNRVILDMRKDGSWKKIVAAALSNPFLHTD